MNDLERYSNAAFLRDMLSTPIEPIPGKGTAPAPDGLLSEEQAATVAGVSRKTISKLIKSGRLEATDYGTKGKHLYRIKPEALAALNSPASEPAPLPRQRRRGRMTTGKVSDWMPRVD